MKFLCRMYTEERRQNLPSLSIVTSQKNINSFFLYIFPTEKKGVDKGFLNSCKFCPALLCAAIFTWAGILGSNSIFLAQRTTENKAKN